VTTNPPAMRAIIQPSDGALRTPQRRAAVTAGALLILGIIGALASGAIEKPLLTATVSLASISPGGSRLPAGGLLELATAVVSAGIAVAMYPVLRKYSQGLALGAVAFRTIECAMYAVAGAITLSMPSLASQYAQALAPARGAVQATASALAGVREDVVLAGVIAYISGSLLYYCVLYRWRLVPRWLAGWGIAAEAPMLAACIAAAVTRNPVTGYIPLILPIFLNELALAAWLIVKGFSVTGASPAGE
jgi:Domain of unknown function (DUF4386)